MTKMMYTPVKCCYSDEHSQDCETDAEWIVTDIDDPTTTLYACSGHLVEMMMNRNYVERFPQAAGRFRLEPEEQPAPDALPCGHPREAMRGGSKAQ